MMQPKDQENAVLRTIFQSYGPPPIVRNPAGVA